MSSSRDSTDLLRKAIVRKIRADFRTANVPGITELPLVIKARPQSFTEPPYIYVQSGSSDEDYKTQEDAMRTHALRAQVVVKSAHNKSSDGIRDNICSEIVRILDVNTSGYIDLEDDGFKVLIQNVGRISTFTNETTRAGTYFIANVDLEFTIDFIGLPSTNPPNFAAIYTYSGWQFNNISRSIELHDAGTITGRSSYSDSNGWENTSVSYALTSTGQGTLSNRSLTITSAQNTIGLVATSQWEFIDDTTITDTVTDTDTWSRIRSLRFGTVAPVTTRTQPTFTDDSAATYGLRNLSAWDSGNRSVRFGTVSPHNTSVTLNATNAGDYLYIVTDANHDLVRIEESVFNQDVLDQFDMTTVGGYNVYLSKRPTVNASESYTYKLTTS